MQLRYLSCKDFAKLLGNRWTPRSVKSWLEGQNPVPTDALLVMQEHLEAERQAVLRHRLPRMPCYRGGRDNLLKVMRELQGLRAIPSRIPILNNSSCLMLSTSYFLSFEGNCLHVNGLSRQLCNADVRRKFLRAPISAIDSLPIFEAPADSNHLLCTVEVTYPNAHQEKS
jgi:hypothetical protein